MLGVDFASSHLYIDTNEAIIHEGPLDLDHVVLFRVIPFDFHRALAVPTQKSHVRNQDQLTTLVRFLFRLPPLVVGRRQVGQILQL